MEHFYGVHCTIHKLERKVVCNITPFVSAEEPFLPLFNKPVSHINLNKFLYLINCCNTYEIFFTTYKVHLYNKTRH